MDFDVVVNMLHSHEYVPVLRSLAGKMGQKAFLEACLSVARETDTPTPTEAEEPKKQLMTNWVWDSLTPEQRHRICREVIQHVSPDWTSPSEIAAQVEDFELDFGNHSVVLCALRFLAHNERSSVEHNGVRGRGSQYRNRGNWAIK